MLEERCTCLFDEMVKSKQGMRQFKTYKSPLLTTTGHPRTVGIAHDVTDLANMGAELEIFLRNMPFAILISGNDGRIINVNAKFEEYFAAKEKNIVGKPMRNGSTLSRKASARPTGRGTSKYGCTATARSGFWSSMKNPFLTYSATGWGSSASAVT